MEERDAQPIVMVMVMVMDLDLDLDLYLVKSISIVTYNLCI